MYSKPSSFCEKFLLRSLLCFLFSTHSLSADLHSYLYGTGLPIISITPFHTNGATNCSYCLLETNEGKYFVKTGEKVSKEINNIIFLEKNSVTCIPRLAKGTSFENEIMITEFIPNSDHGFKMINDFHSGKISSESFLKFQSNALNLLQQFYRIPEFAKVNMDPGVFTGRINQRIQDLLLDQDKIVVKSDDGDLPLRLLLNAPILYRSKNNTHHLPSLLEIAEEVNVMLRELPPLKKHVLHGDFHAPNICMNENKELVLVDLSDIMLLEEPAWDLGKWLNHFTRLYRVVASRGENQPDLEISFSFIDSTIVIEDYHQELSLEKIRREAVSQFANMIAVDRDLIDVKTSAAEFIVNLSTLRRHMMRFPHSTRGVLACIADSYLDFKKRFYFYKKMTE